MDETIKLTEWLAFHWTTFPLRHVILGLSAESRRLQEIETIVGLWKGRIDISIWNHSRYMNFHNQTGWERQLSGNEKDPSSFAHKSLVHKRNQKAFTLQCLWATRKARKSWTLVTDVDEFFIFNYLGRYENASQYETEWRGWTREQIHAERLRVKPIREALPPLTQRMTVLEVLNKIKHKNPCILFPQLKFSSYESDHIRETLDTAQSSPIDDIQFLLTRRFVYHGPPDGKFSKAILDLKANGRQYRSFVAQAYQSIHNPHKGYCGDVGRTGSGADYMSSLVRVNHYQSGTIESLLERGYSDYRINDKKRFQDFFLSRNLEPVGTNVDIQPWVDWFIDIVGQDEAMRLLFNPLHDMYQQLGNYSFPGLTKELRKFTKDAIND